MEDIIYKKIDIPDQILNLEATIYRSKPTDTKAVILYYHGGGLLYGNRNDLPKYHIDRLTSSGYTIISFDYRLAPEAAFDLILSDIVDSIEYYIENRSKLGFDDIPYFLWGRSAGAYLALLSYTKGLTIDPKGIVSYYGYGFTVPGWYDSSSIDYLKYPPVKKEDALKLVNSSFIVQGHINKRFPLYLYGRQIGSWFNMLSGGREDFLSKYSLLSLGDYPDFPPTLLAHSYRDYDVPFRESMELGKLIKNSTLFTCSADIHDFDRQEKNKDTINLLDKTLEFLDANI